MEVPWDDKRAHAKVPLNDGSTWEVHSKQEKGAYYEEIGQEERASKEVYIICGQAELMAFGK